VRARKSRIFGYCRAAGQFAHFRLFASIGARSPPREAAGWRFPMIFASGWWRLSTLDRSPPIGVVAYPSSRSGRAIPSIPWTSAPAGSFSARLRLD
jgi:hypothetical protein